MSPCTRRRTQERGDSQAKPCLLVIIFHLRLFKGLLLYKDSWWIYTASYPSWDLSSTTLKYFFCKIPVLGKEEILGLLKCTFDFFTNPFQTFGHSGWPSDIKQSSFFTCKLFFDFIKLLLHYVH